MRLNLHMKENLDPVVLEVGFVAVLMMVLVAALYYYGAVYLARAEVSHLIRYPSMF